MRPPTGPPMDERDYSQRPLPRAIGPVDEVYQHGIEHMGQGGPRVSAGEWFEAIARIMASGLAMRGGVGEPWRYPASSDALLQYRNLLRRMSLAGGRTRPTPPTKQSGSQAPKPGELDPAPHPLAQPSELPKGGNEVPPEAARGASGDQFFHYVKQLYRGIGR